MERNETVSVSIDGVSFTVEGTWVPPEPGVEHTKSGDPGSAPEGGYFSDYKIRVGDADITPIAEQYNFAEDILAVAAERVEA
jgi:hypothetical protein